ncbi:hypothetical protein BGHDH14_bgh01341 [Blumeria hordei DH14]|uniref:Uncharacterized protein n=1 Tax=Blumeria graminis f. sp. hordei (strain DH14) TaxID=546991 RepID=N1JEI6_BLUG1|nr:hypothetical protein BGHDH14_bgh01341 [Blumeria hordei DH14]
MNRNSHIEPQQATGPNSTRQSHPSFSPGNNNKSGMSGAVGFTGGVGGYPTPIGHQSDLSFVMSLVEDLSQVLQTNQALTAGVVDRMGKIREKAKLSNLKNEDIIAAAATELNEESKNIEKENLELRSALETSENDRKENWKLAVQGANILTDITEKMHRFKEQHEVDTIIWHRSYRKQLAAEREENLNLRCQINDMKSAACRANETLPESTNISLRPRKRYWKRLALPLISDDDPEWSDDDDLIDPEERKD